MGKAWLALVLLWPLAALAAEVDLPELAVSLTALPVGADKPEEPTPYAEAGVGDTGGGSGSF